MTKQIRLKDGKVLKVESCLKCPLFYADGEWFMGCYTCKGNMNIDVEYPSQNNHIHNECPLEDYQEPAAPTEQGTTKGDICTMLCPDCHTLIHIESCPVIAEKDAEIIRLKNQCDNYHEAIEVLRESKDLEIAKITGIKDAAMARVQRMGEEIRRLTGDKSLCIQELDRFKKKYDERVTEVMRLNDRIVRQDQELKDLGKALEYKCQMREATERKEPPKDEPELVIYPDAKQCKVEVCGAKTPHKKTELCDDLSCPVNGERSGPCIPVKKEQAVPEMQQPFDIQKAHTAQIETCQGRLDKLEESCDQHYKAQVSHTDYAVESRRRIDALEKEIAAIREKVSNS